MSKMKKVYHIFLACTLLLAGCERSFVEDPTPEILDNEDNKVTITFPVALPIDDPATRVMADDPDVKNIYLAVFGGSGYFNEWVPAEVAGTELAKYNYADYDGEDHDFKIYNLKVKLSMSDSRLRVHVIANCPLTSPPISGVSSEDTEDIVMSKVRSQIGSDINDAYWQKIILPYGIKAQTEITNGVEQYKLDPVTHERIPTVQTVEQFTKKHNPIPLVRNFARIRLIKDPTLTDVQIDKFCLAYAPAEGPVAPILSGMYTSDIWGAPITVPDSDTETTVYNETFFINYQDYPLESDDETVTKLSDAPFNYRGYSPADLALGTYPEDADGMQDWSLATQESNYLYVYERAKPRSGQKSTRIIIRAKKGSEAWKYYPLDIIDTTGTPSPLLRNFTYTVTLSYLAEGTGETTIAKAAVATAANVSGDEKTQDLNEVSDGVALISVSYIDATYIKSGTYDRMFHFEPLLGIQANDQVTLKVGYNNGTDGFVENNTSANGSAFAPTPTIEKSGNSPVLYVKVGNRFEVATATQIADNTIDKWGKIQYTTAAVDRNGAAAVDNNGNFTKGFTQTIRVIGNKNDNTQIYRDVQINLIPRRILKVECLDKYIEETAGALERVRVYIPTDLTRSMFPLQFMIESDESTLNPIAGQNLPVNSGESLTGDGSTTYYFLKNLTKDVYESLSTATVDGTTMKYFECTFKSIEDVSACSVYVGNEFFVTDSDNFYNYTKRQFTNPNIPASVHAGGNVNFTFTMDAAHNGTPTVWNEGTSSQKVLPSIVTVTLTGLEPLYNTDGSLFDTRLTRVSNGVYNYAVTDLTNITPTLHLVGSTTAESYSVTLSTSAISPNPLLYNDLTVTGQIEKSNIVDPHFENASGTRINSVLSEADQPVYFCFTYDGPQVPVTFKLNGLVPDDSRVSGSATYTFTPSGGGAQRIQLKTASASTDAVSLTDLTVSSETYNQPSPNSFTLNMVEIKIVAISNPGTGQRTVTNDPVSVTFSNIRNSYPTYIQLNRNSTITITTNSNPRKTITRVVVHFNGNNTGNITASGYSNGTWTGSSTSVTLNQGGGDRAQISSIDVYYD